MRRISSGCITRLESMTELTSPTDDPARVDPASTDPASTEAPVQWPARAEKSAVGDPTVDVLLGSLDPLPGLPVSVHGEIYATLHDGLAEALNQDVAGEHDGSTKGPAGHDPA